MILSIKNKKNDKKDNSHKNKNDTDYIELRDLSVKQKLFDDPHLEREWKSLISKHKLRYDIWMVIDLNNELNVTQISKVIGHSKSTISRVLKSMEINGLLVSHRGEIKEGGRERIPPKYYRISKKFKIDKDAEQTFGSTNIKT